ncbi:MAG: tRNA (N(6)-L-threonylcarbamoyladenosine(37)-C(2))-methylthiotransferase MtaB [Planctomycetes bacterium]|nr:tRNA (N(6)-L-threonylcarbamoyladenosine(37)-C(2))-methylthiotransferase MtaB [Planctomycetota bacterium]
MQPTCRIVTFGCKANQYDTQVVRESLLDVGFREAVAGELAELCVVNTCTVTHQADADGRRAIRRLARENPGTRIVVMGCYASRDPQTLRSIPGVAAVVDHPDRVAEVLAPFGVRRLPNGISKFAGHHRAFVKVQDGCLLNCTFCIIPQVRPSLRSRPPQEIEQEVRRLVGAGFHEIVLTGIHLGHYGVEFSRGRPRREWCRLSHLIQRLVRIPGDWRLRLSSLEATEVTDELVDVLAGESRVCPHLHLCLQSGSDTVLRAMKRRYRVAGFLRRVEQIRHRFDRPALTTDVIVGFPGETERDFDQTLRVCEQAGFSKIHIFPFSPRSGTPAATMPGQLAPEVIQERKTRLAALESELAARYYQYLLGCSLQVLVERVSEVEPQRSAGTACRYVPVRFIARRTEAGELISLRVVEATASHLRGERESRGAEPTHFGFPVLPVLNRFTSAQSLEA